MTNDLERLLSEATSDSENMTISVRQPAEGSAWTVPRNDRLSEVRCESPESRTVLDRIPTWLATVVIAALVAFAYGFDLGRNPFGFFCDEALIGIKAQELLRGERPDGAFPFFFDHFGYTSGTLPLYATAPFVWLFGLTEFAVRLASVFFMVATFAVLYGIFRHLRLSAPWLPVLIFALSPVVIHLSRVNFGHTPSLFLIASGYALYLLGRDRGRIALSMLGGAAIGLSAYGYPGFYLATALFVASLTLTELVAVRFRPRRVGHLVALAIVAGICFIPIAHQALTSPDFSNRFDDKDTAGYGLVSIDRAESMIQNVQKYYSYEFLFADGETGLPGSFILRHSVTGAGLLSRTAIPLLLLGIVAFLLARGGPGKRAFAPFFVLVLLYPLPDLVTTTMGSAPYTFSVFTAALLVPFVIAYGLEVLAVHRASRERAGTDAPESGNSGQGANRPDPLGAIWTRLISVRVITFAVAISGFLFVFATYAAYPLTSSGYWGWQSGPRDMIGYYQDREQNYDAFYMESVFNQGEVFLDFYIDDPDVRKKAFIGGVEAINTSQRQLFGFSRETWQNPDHQQLFSTFAIRETVHYPDGTDAFYLVERAP